MYKKFLIFLSILLLWSIVTRFVSTTFAEEITEDQLLSQKGQTLQQIEQQRIQIELSQQEANSEASKLEEIEKRLSEAERLYEDLSNKVATFELEISKLQEKSKVLEVLVEKRREILRKRIRDIYKKGQISYLDVLLGATDFVDFATRIQVLQKVLTNDLNLINDVISRQQELFQMQRETEKIYRKQNELREEAKIKSNEIKTEKEKQQKIYNKIIQNKEVAEQQLKELENTSRKVEIALKRLKGGVVGSTGNFIRPTDGVITSVFSTSRIHPVFGNVRPHNGTDIGDDYNTPIKAADGGEIVYSGWMSGYGFVVIINHGNSFTTLYAHQMGQPPVAVGQSVSQGETIGYVGSTGYSTGPHLHFEIRENGELRDPYYFIQY